jgi:hypothetical protein
MEYNIRKNHKFTDKMISSLLQKNGNTFYLNSTYTTFSRIWTYTENTFEIYKLANGKVYEKTTYSDNGFSNIGMPESKEIDLEIEECKYELDGDFFGYRIKTGSEIKQQDLLISIECFTKKKYKSEFLSKIVEDINIHKIRDVRGMFINP